MDGSGCDHVSGIKIVDLCDRASNCQHTDTVDRVPLPCQTSKRTGSLGNVPIARTHHLNSRSVQTDYDVSIEIDVSSTATNMSPATADILWCWNGACICPHCARQQHEGRECADGTHILSNATITTELLLLPINYKESENCLFRDTCDSGVNNVPETAEIVCDYTSVCDDENISLDANKPLVYDEKQCNVMHNEAVLCQKSGYPTQLNERHTAPNDMRSLTACSEQCDSTTNLSDATVGERTYNVTTLGSMVAAVYVASLQNQKSSMPECLLPENKELVHDGQQPLSAVCISPPPNSTKVSELPPLSFPPIFYISMDNALSLNLSATEKQNAVLKSELPNINPRFAERCDSQLSTLSEKQDICRICHCEAELANKLISPCLCSGSLKYIHLCCLQKWIKSSDKKSCELCNFDYIMTMKIRPFKQWERLDMTVAERRKIVCSVTFHIIAITCVIWSLYVLIDRTTEEVNAGTLDWPFWTKLIVVAIGFTGGLVFMYVQCKMYLQLCLRWRQYNKLINIENAPEDVHLRAEAAARIKARSNEAGGIVNTVALQEVDSF